MPSFIKKVCSAILGMSLISPPAVAGERGAPIKGRGNTMTSSSGGTDVNVGSTAFSGYGYGGTVINMSGASVNQSGGASAQSGPAGSFTNQWSDGRGITSSISSGYGGGFASGGANAYGTNWNSAYGGSSWNTVNRDHHR